MVLNELGKILETNDVRVGSEVVQKRFKPFALTMIWGAMERKPFLSAQQRYSREKRLVVKLADNRNLNVQDLLAFDDQNFILQYRAARLTDFINLFKDPVVHRDDKLGYFKKSLESLREIHNTGEYHGDTYLKNFFKIESGEKQGQVFTCDFEFERDSANPQITDVLIVTANSINALSKANGIKPEVVLNTASEVYGSDISYPFDLRDRAFFRLRFAVGQEFFDYFSAGRSFK